MVSSLICLELFSKIGLELGIIPTTFDHVEILHLRLKEVVRHFCVLCTPSAGGRTPIPVKPAQDELYKTIMDILNKKSRTG